MIISQPSSTLLTIRYTRAAHSLTCSLSLYSTVKTNILYFSPQALTKMKITAFHNEVWKDFIYCADDRCFKIELYHIW